MLDPARPAVELERVVRALTPHIGAHIELPDGSRLGRARGARARAAAARRRACSRSTARGRCSGAPRARSSWSSCSRPGGADERRGLPARAYGRRAGAAGLPQRARAQRLAGARLRVRRRAPRVRAGRLRRSRACTPRPPELDAARPRARDGARLRHGPAAGDARPRRGAARARPPASARPAGARRAARSGCSSCCSSTASPTTPRSTRASSWSSARAGAARARQRGAAPCRAEGPRDPRRARRRAPPPARRSCTRCRSGWPQRWWDELGADEARALLAHGQRARRVGAAGQHARRRAPTRSSRGCRSRHGRRGRCRRGSCSTRAFDAHGSELWRAGRDHAPVARLDARRARARAAPGRAGARSVRRARGQDDAPGGADGGRGELVAVERHRGRAERARQDLRAACTPAACGSRSATPARPPDAARVRPRARRPAVQRARHAAVASRPALARESGAIEELAALQARILRGGRRRDRAGRGARLLGLHDLAGGGPGGGRAASCVEHPEFVGRRPRLRVPGLEHPRRASYLQLLPHRDAPMGSSSPACAAR